MRRLFAIFLLVLLPLQLSWASVAPYCQHETDSQAQHLGHHDHQHQTANDKDGPDSKLPGQVDNDCGTCHAGCCIAAMLDMIGTPTPGNSSDPFDAYRMGLASPHLAVPERPSWWLLA